MSRYRDDSRDERDRDPRGSRDDGSTEDRYRGGGRARSFAEERFNEAQRNAPERDARGQENYERENYERARQNFDRDRSSQFDYGETRQQDQPGAGDDRVRNERSRDDRNYGANTASQYNDSRGEPYRDELAASEGDARHFYRGEEENRRVRYEKERNPRGEISNRSGSSGGRLGGSTASRSHVRCRDIMTRDVTVATRETTLQEVAAMMRDEDTGVIPVVENANNSATTANASAPDTPESPAASTSTLAQTDATANADTPPITDVSGNAMRGGNATLDGYGKLVGLITDRDIVIRAIAEGKDATQTRAADIMTEEVYTAQPNDRVIDAIREMGDKQVRRIPVCDRDGKLRGIISMADVALETEEDSELAKALEEISSGASFWGKMFG